MEDSNSIGKELNAALRENIAQLEQRRTRERAEASLSERMAEAITGFMGSMKFAVLHLVVYGAWLLINLGFVPGIPRFDPSFVILACEASVEAIFLSTFVLISQNRMAAAADRRADLDLHINLLTEHELTKLAELVAGIATKLNVPQEEHVFREISTVTDPLQVLDEIEAKQKPGDADKPGDDKAS